MKQFILMLGAFIAGGAVALAATYTNSVPASYLSRTVTWEMPYEAQVITIAYNSLEADYQSDPNVGGVLQNDSAELTAMASRIASLEASLTGTVRTQDLAYTATWRLPYESSSLKTVYNSLTASQKAGAVGTELQNDAARLKAIATEISNAMFDVSYGYY